MKRYFAGAALALLVAATSSADGMQAGINFGPTWAMSGRSPIFLNGEGAKFKDDIDLGWTLGGYVAGPFSGSFGWRGDFGYAKLPADADRAAGRVSGDYKLYNVQGGIQFGDFSSESKGKPYGFITIGLTHEDASVNTTINNTDFQYDFNGRSAFGWSFGGGYNYLIGETWGLGGDLHINGGKFEDDTRWWWTPSGQVFFKF